jgi:hypothetical protein
LGWSWVGLGRAHPHFLIAPVTLYTGLVGGTLRRPTCWWTGSACPAPCLTLRSTSSTAPSECLPCVRSECMPAGGKDTLLELQEAKIPCVSCIRAGRSLRYHRQHVVLRAPDESAGAMQQLWADPLCPLALAPPRLLACQCYVYTLKQTYSSLSSVPLLPCTGTMLLLHDVWLVPFCLLQAVPGCGPWPLLLPAQDGEPPGSEVSRGPRGTSMHLVHKPVAVANYH